jgi:urease accessory protein
MEIATEILGNIHQHDWQQKLIHTNTETVYLNQWTAQKSRFVIDMASGKELAVALKRNERIKDGDIIYYSAIEQKAIVIRLDLNPILVINMKAIASKDSSDVMRIALELGHALGNQHWPAVIKGYKVYVPLTVDKQVMLSVMQTHHFEDIVYEFQAAEDIVPYLAPHEVRRLLGGTEPTHDHNL